MSLPETLTDTSTITGQIADLLTANGNYLPADDEAPETNSAPERVSDEGNYVANDGESVPTPEQSDQPESDDEAEQDASSAIAPPKSWNAAEKELFQELPPEAQSVIARRERERDSAINKRMQELASERKTIESDIQRANTERAQYAQTLNQLLTLTLPELQQFDNLDWQRLAREEPARYVELQATYNGLQQRVRYMDAEGQRVQQQLAQQQQAALQRHTQEQFSMLVQAVPEFGEPEKAKVLGNQISAALKPYGFTDAELGTIVDHRIFRVMADYARLKNAESARSSAQTKKAPTPAPRVMQPNASQPRAERGQGKKIEDQFRQLARSHKGRDAARLLENIL